MFCRIVGDRAWRARNGAARLPAASHDAQQLALAKWILSQKAYAETAFAIGTAAGKSAEEIVAIYKDSISSVLANATKHNNNAVGHPVLKAHADSIIQRK